MEGRKAGFPILQKGGGELRFLQILSLVALVFVVVQPPEGVGFSVCFFYNMTGLPDPGCGVMRSMTNILHLQFSRALAYNPFGFPILAALLFFVASAFSNTLSGLFRRYRMSAVVLLVLGAALLLFFGGLRFWLLLYARRSPDEFLELVACLPWLSRLLAAW